MRRNPLRGFRPTRSVLRPPSMAGQDPPYARSSPLYARYRRAGLDPPYANYAGERGRRIKALLIASVPFCPFCPWRAGPFPQSLFRKFTIAPESEVGCMHCSKRDHGTSWLRCGRSTGSKAEDGLSRRSAPSLRVTPCSIQSRLRLRGPCFLNCSKE